MEKWYQDTYPVELKMSNVEYDWKGKRVLDLGCHIGLLGNYMYGQGVQNYIGIDFNEKFIEEGKRRNPDFALYHGEALSMLQKFNNNVDVVVALGLFHHLPDSEVSRILHLCTIDLIFEVPTGEKKSNEYRVRTIDWYMDMLEYKDIVVKDSKMPLDKSYPFDRKIFICKGRKSE